MLKKKLAVAILGALMFNPVILPPNNFFPARVVYAEVKTIEADGYYIMGDGTEETQGVAKARAREDAKRAASEQACTFIESISEIKNGNLTRDEIRTISASILKIIEAPVNPEISGGSIMFHCKIKVEVDTSNVTDKLLQDRQKFAEYTRQIKEKDEEIERLNAEMNTLKQKFETASTYEKEEINAEVKRNENQFNALLWNEKAFQYNMAGDYKNALESAKKAVSFNQQLDAAWVNMGYAYNFLGEYGRAIDALTNAVELYTKYESAYGNLGFAHYLLGNYSLAIDYFLKALDMNPNDSVIYYNIGAAYNLLGEYEQSLEYLNKSIELNPDNANSKKLRDDVLAKIQGR